MLSVPVLILAQGYHRQYFPKQCTLKGAQWEAFVTFFFNLCECVILNSCIHEMFHMQSTGIPT